MSEKSSKKRGFFGLFGGKKDQKDEQQDNVEQTEVEIESEQSNLQQESAVSIGEEPDVNQSEQILENNKQATQTDDEPQVTEDLEQKPEETAKELSFFQRLKQGLSKTRTQFSEGIANLVLGQKEIDDDVLEEVETLLLMADVGVDTTSKIVDDLTEKAGRKELKDTTALMARLKELLKEIVVPVQAPLTIPKQDTPFVILMVGVNGVGKTTTIGKLAHQFKAEGKSVMLAAGDTFRAAAVEQLTAWGERNDVPVIAQHTGADSASVIFDAVEAAKARNVDVVIADTAGRLHNKSNLMEELSKVKRVMAKVDQSAPHEVMLVVDAGTGQNALVQAQEFNKAVTLNSVTITKLDGTAKGGVVFALADKMKLPIRYIGVGEAKQDLREFNANDYIDALFE